MSLRGGSRRIVRVGPLGWSSGPALYNLNRDLREMIWRAVAHGEEQTRIARVLQRYVRRFLARVQQLAIQALQTDETLGDDL